MPEVDFEDLIHRYRKEECTKQEIAEVESWYIYMTANSKLEEAPVDLEAIGKRIWDNIMTKVRPRKGNLIRHDSWKIWTTAAAVVAIVVSIGFFLYVTNFRSVEKPIIAKSHKIKSSRNTTILKLANGKEIDLTNAPIGTLATFNGVRISKSADGRIIQEITNMQQAISNRGMNIITIPNGRRIEISLTDGTLACLNAASRLTYPNVFTDNKRDVGLDGEGYFEVAKDAKKPFSVSCNKQITKVVGTHFNVKSYVGEPVVTTLLEGKVTVQELSGESESLTPGQQSIFDGQNFSIQKVNPDDAISWRGGELVFDQTPLKEALQQIRRCFDVNVNYDRLPENKINARLNTDMKLSEVVEKLEIGSGVQLKIENDTIKVK